MQANRDERTYAIIGAAMEVHQELGCGFLEAVYQQALAREFTARKVPFDSQVAVPVSYKGEPLDVSYRADFLCYSSIIVELKALSSLSAIEEAQVINYLKATQYKVGLLINFGAKSLQYKRLVF